jgi:hypothetical protein
MIVRWIEESAPVRWLEGPGQLGILDATQTAQAKALLASWNATDGNQCISQYGLQPEDVNPIAWYNRDGWVLSCFTNWWNINHKAPALPPPGTKDGVGWVDIDQEHLTALQQWGLSKGVINAGQASCAANCQNKYALDPVNLATCLAVCATGAPPPGTQPPVSKSCKPGYYLDPKTNECLPGSGPLPPPPNPIAPTSTAGVSSGTGLLVIGAVVLAAVAIFAAVVGGTGGAAVPRANPRRKRRVTKSRLRSARQTRLRKPRHAAANPEEAPIANPCDAPGLLYGDNEGLFYWSLGAYGSTHVYTWADSYESAEEIMLEWVDDNAPGLLSWAESEEDEVDMIVVGHTTLKHGNVMPSWEVHVNEVHGKKREAIKRLSQIYCEDEGPLPLPAGG